MSLVRGAMLAAAIFAASACGSSEESSAPAGSTSSSSSGGLSSGGSTSSGGSSTSSSGGSSGDAASTKAVTEKPAPECHDLAQQGTEVEYFKKTEDAPPAATPKATSIPDGVYVLVDSAEYNNKPPHPTNPMRTETVAIVGDRWYAVGSGSSISFSDTAIWRGTRTWTISAGKISWVQVCPEGSAPQALTIAETSDGFRIFRYSDGDATGRTFVDTYQRVVQ